MNLKSTLFLLLTTLNLTAQDFFQSRYQDSFVNDFAVADYDGDGNQDFIALDRKFEKPSDIYLYKNTGTGEIAFQEILLQESYDTGGKPLAVDFDQDGDMDFLISKGENVDIMLFSNNGDATFEEQLLMEEGGDIFKVADMDNDGDLDIFLIDTEFNSLTVLKNRGADGFSRDRLIDNNPRLKSYDIGDLNQDGKIDIVVGFETFFAKQVSVFYAREDFGYREKEIFEDDFDDLADIKLGDLNNDGQLDIIAGNDEEIGLWINQGDLNFEKQILAENINNDPFGFIQLDMVDINGDGELDVVASIADEGIVWYENDGLSFERRAVGSVRPTFSLANGDFDGDGDTDLIASNGDLWWFENQVAQIVSSIIPIEKTKMRLFPNPFTDYLQIDGLAQTPYQLQLIDATGRVVISQKITKGYIPTPNLPIGKYQLQLLHLTTGDIISSSVIKLE